MRLTLGHQGDWVVDPRELATKLGVSTEDLKRMTQRGYVDARIKDGTGDDKGRTRVTIRPLKNGWRGTFDQSGTLISEEKW